MAPHRASRPARILCGALLSGCVIFAASNLSAQDSRPDITTIDRPLGESSASYNQSLRGTGVESDIRYADYLSEDLLSGEVKEVQPTRPARQGTPIRLGGGWGVFLIIGLLVVGLLLWLRFGGTGALLSQTPKAEDGATEAPEGWRIDASERNMDGQSLIDQIRAMADRRAAMVRLLRHALLAAGTDSQTRFARSDTEREAFGRLPRDWPHHEILNLLLRATELAHYGGRDVSEEAFENALAQGTAILGQRRAKSGGTHA